MNLQKQLIFVDVACNVFYLSIAICLNLGNLGRFFFRKLPINKQRQN